MRKIRRGFSTDFYLMNEILKEWNPIGVIGPALDDEYISYIPNLLKAKDNVEKLRQEIGEIEEDLGMSFNRESVEWVISEIQKIN